MARRRTATLRNHAAPCLAWLVLAGPALASQGPGAAEGMAGPAERALAFILALPLTLVAVGLMRRR